MPTLNSLLSECIRDVDTLKPLLHLSEEEAARLDEIAKRYPICIPPYYLSLIDQNDPSDPIRKMCIPGTQEFTEAGHEDTSGEGDNTVMTGMQHKYRQTALILSTSQCSMYCRHCFRKRMVGYSSEETASHIPDMVSYVKSHPEINNVLISGGDSFINENEVIAEYLDAFTALPSLDFIRFGTRTPVVLPARIYSDPDLLSIIQHYNRKKQILIITHFNHPHEITEKSEQAVRALMDCGCVIRNQSVLLKGVNDDPVILSRLQNQLVTIGVIPYYVFQCRPARGVVNEFQVPLETGSRIVEEARKQMNGQSKSLHYVLSHVTGKIEILGRMPGGDMLFKYHQAKHDTDHSRIFTAALAPDQCWLDAIPG